MAEDQFDLVVIGGGAGGLVAAVGAVQLGAKVALVEKGKLGGDCLNYGCVPSKGIIRSARLAESARNMGKFGIEVDNVRVNFRRVMERMKEAQAQIGKHDSRERFEAMGIEMIFGEGQFIDPDTFEVAGRHLRAKRFLIATGSSPFVPPLPGIESVPYLTNETVFDLEESPQRMIVIGAGPIGLEMAQAFHQLGSEVEVLEVAPKLLPRFDEEMAKILSDALSRSGIRFHFEFHIGRVKKEDGKIIVEGTDANGPHTFSCGALVVAVGRSVNVEGIGLNEAGVKYSKHGVEVNHFLCTSNPRIFAVGDVLGKFQFTHMAEYEAGVALRNMLFSEPFGLPVPFLKVKAEYHAVPWCIYTSPEAAHVGMGEHEARTALGEKNCQVFRFPMDHVDRAIVDGETEGFCKIVCDKKGRLIGADLVGQSAGDILHEFVLAVRKKLHVRDIIRTVHVYPTLAQVNKRTAGQYYVGKLFRPEVRRRFRRLFGLKGNLEVHDPLAISSPE